MRGERLAGAASVVLGLGMALNAMLGPLVLGGITSRVSESAEDQLAGGEVVSLLLAAPLAVIAGALWSRGHRLGPLLAAAPALYALYTYVQAAVGPEYARYPGNVERAFPLYLLLIVLGWAVALRAWTAAGALDLREPPAQLRRALAVVLLILSGAIALAWTGGIVDALNGGALPEGYAEDTTLFWLVRLMDLGFVLPAAVVAAVGLLRRAPWATRLACVMASFQTLLVAAVASMSIAMALQDDPATSYPLLVVTSAAAVVLAALTVRLLRAALAPPAAPVEPDGTAAPRGLPPLRRQSHA